MDDVKRLQKMIDSHSRIVFFGGAGVSTESGIPDYRSSAGIDRLPGEGGFTPEEMRHHDFLMMHPDLYFRNFRVRAKILDVAPNAAHFKLAELERAGKLSAVVTQNIDGLHQKAGSANVFELHGTYMRGHCVSCGKPCTLTELTAGDGVPRCSCGGMLRPDIVLFGESLDDDVVSGAVEAIRGADMLIVGGTSLAVWPAAGLVDYFRGDCLAIINREPPQGGYAAHISICGSIADVMSRIEVR